VFHYLLLRGEVDHNPARDVKIPRKLVDGEGRAFRPEEVSQLLKYLKKDRFYIAYLLGFKTGMRYGEIQGLKFSDIDFENGIIHINRQFSSTEGKIVDRLKTEKSKAALRVTTDVIKELVEWKQIVEAEKAALGSKYADEDLVVCTPNGTPTSHVTLRAHLRKASVFLGFGHCKLHTMRHTYATVLSKKLMPQELKKYLRHKNHLVSLNTYTHDYDHIVGDTEVLQDLYGVINKD
jgi:integrase